jgi:hypothetical protein
MRCVNSKYTELAGSTDEAVRRTDAPHEYDPTGMGPADNSSSKDNQVRFSTLIRKIP